MAYVIYSDVFEHIRIHIATPTEAEASARNLTLAKTNLYALASKPTTRVYPLTTYKQCVEIPMCELYTGEYKYVNSCGRSEDDERHGKDRRNIFCQCVNGKFNIALDKNKNLTKGVFITLRTQQDPSKSGGNTDGIESFLRTYEEVNKHVRISGEEPDHNSGDAPYIGSVNSMHFNEIDKAKYNELYLKYRTDTNIAPIDNAACYGVDDTHVFVPTNSSGAFTTTGTPPNSRYKFYGTTKSYFLIVPPADDKVFNVEKVPSAIVQNTSIDTIPTAYNKIWSNEDIENWFYVCFASNAFKSNSPYANLNNKLFFKFKVVWVASTENNPLPSMQQELYRSIGTPDFDNGVLDGGSIVSEHYPEDDADSNPKPFNTYKFDSNKASELEQDHIKKPLVSCWSDSIYVVLIDDMTKTALTAKAIKDYVDDCFKEFAEYVQDLCASIISFIVTSTGDIFSGTNITLGVSGNSANPVEVNINNNLKSGIYRIIKNDDFLDGTFPPIEDYTGYIAILDISNYNNSTDLSYYGKTINEYDKIRIRQIIYPDDYKTCRPWTRVGVSDAIRDNDGNILFGYTKNGEKVIDEDTNNPITDTLVNDAIVPADIDESNYDSKYPVFKALFKPNALYQDTAYTYSDRTDKKVVISWSDWIELGGSNFSADNICHKPSISGSNIDVNINNTDIIPGIYRIKKSDYGISLTGEFPPIDDWTGFMLVMNIAESSIDEEPGDKIRQIVYPDDINNQSPWTRIYDKYAIDNGDETYTGMWSDWNKLDNDAFGGDNILHALSVENCDINSIDIISGVYRVRKSDNPSKLTGDFPPINDWTGFLVVHNILKSSFDENPGDHIRQILYPDDSNNSAPWTRVYTRSSNSWSDWAMMGGDGFAGESVGSPRISSQIANYIGVDSIINNNKINVNSLQKPGVYRVGTDGTTAGTYILEGDKPPIMGSTDMGYITVFAIDNTSIESDTKKRIRQCYYPDDPNTGSPMTRTGTSNYSSGTWSSITWSAWESIGGGLRRIFVDDSIKSTVNGERVIQPLHNVIYESYSDGDHLLLPNPNSVPIGTKIGIAKHYGTGEVSCNLGNEILSQEVSPTFSEQQKIVTRTVNNVKSKIGTITPRNEIELIYNFHPGWNLIGIPITVVDSNGNQVTELSKILQVDGTPITGAIYEYTNGSQYLIARYAEPGKAYFAFVHNYVTVTISGYINSTEIQLYQGYNFISVPTRESNLRELVSSGKISRIQTYDGEKYVDVNVNDVDIMSGYWVTATENCALSCTYSESTHDEPTRASTNRTEISDWQNAILSSKEYIFECCISEDGLGHEWVLDYEHNEAKVLADHEEKIANLKNRMGRQLRHLYYKRSNTDDSGQYITCDTDVTNYDNNNLDKFDILVDINVTSDDINKTVLNLPTVSDTKHAGAYVEVTFTNSTADIIKVKIFVQNSSSDTENVELVIPSGKYICRFAVVQVDASTVVWSKDVYK